MDFGELVDATLDDLNLQPVSAGVTETVTRVRRWINDAHRIILRDPRTAGLRAGSLSFSSVAGQQIVALPQAFERLITIVQPTTNIRLRLMTDDAVKLIDPGDRSLGQPTHWVPWGYVQVLVQPGPTTPMVFAASDNPADTTFAIMLTGVSAAGDTVVLPGTVPLNPTDATLRVPVSAVQTIIAWSVVPSAAGTLPAGAISLWSAATGGVCLARTPRGATAVQYQAIRLWPTPSDARTYLCTGEFQIPLLAADGDVPLVPPSYHDMLGIYARMRQYRKEGDTTRYALEQAEWETWLGRLRAFVQYPPDYFPVAGSLSEGVGFSDLGPGYPNDRWILP